MFRKKKPQPQQARKPPLATNVPARRAPVKLSISEYLQQAQGALRRLRGISPGDLQAFPLLNEIQRLVQHIREASAALNPVERDAWQYQIADLEDEFRELADAVVAKADAAPKPEPRPLTTESMSAPNSARGPGPGLAGSGRVQQAVAFFSRQEGAPSGDQAAPGPFLRRVNVQQPQPTTPEQLRQASQASAYGPMSPSSPRTGQSYIYLTEEEREELASRQRTLLEKHQSFLEQQRAAQLQQLQASRSSGSLAALASGQTQASQGMAGQARPNGAFLQQQQAQQQWALQQQEQQQAHWAQKQQLLHRQQQAQYQQAQWQQQVAAQQQYQQQQLMLARQQAQLLAQQQAEQLQAQQLQERQQQGGPHSQTSSMQATPHAYSADISQAASTVMSPAWSATAAAAAQQAQHGLPPQPEPGDSAAGMEDDLFSGLDIVAADESHGGDRAHASVAAPTVAQERAEERDTGLAAASGSAAPAAAEWQQEEPRTSYPVQPPSHSFRPAGHSIPHRLYAGSQSGQRMDLPATQGLAVARSSDGLAADARPGPATHEGTALAQSHILQQSQEPSQEALGWQRREQHAPSQPPESSYVYGHQQAQQRSAVQEQQHQQSVLQAATRNPDPRTQPIPDYGSRPSDPSSLLSPSSNQTGQEHGSQEQTGSHGWAKQPAASAFVARQHAPAEGDGGYAYQQPGNLMHHTGLHSEQQQQLQHGLSASQRQLQLPEVAPAREQSLHPRLPHEHNPGHPVQHAGHAGATAQEQARHEPHQLRPTLAASSAVHHTPLHHRLQPHQPHSTGQHQYQLHAEQQSRTSSGGQVLSSHPLTPAPGVGTPPATPLPAGLPAEASATAQDGYSQSRPAGMSASASGYFAAAAAGGAAAAAHAAAAGAPSGYRNPPRGAAGSTSGLDAARSLIARVNSRAHAAPSPQAMAANAAPRPSAPTPAAPLHSPFADAGAPAAGPSPQLPLPVPSSAQPAPHASNTQGTLQNAAMRSRSRNLFSGGGGRASSCGGMTTDPAALLPTTASLPSVRDLEEYLDNATGSVDACRAAAEQRARAMVAELGSALAAAQKVEAGVQQQRRSVKAALMGLVTSIGQLEAQQAGAVEAEDFEAAAALDEQLTQQSYRRAQLEDQERVLAAALQKAAALRLEVLGRQAEAWRIAGAYLARLQVGQQQMAAALAAQAEREAQAAATLHRAAQDALAQRRALLEERNAELSDASAVLTAQIAEATAPAEAERERRARVRDALQAEVESLRAMLAAKEAALSQAEAAVSEAAEAIREQAAAYDRDVSCLDEARALLDAEAAQVAGQEQALQESERQATARSAAVEEHQAQLRLQADALGGAAEAMRAEAEALAARVTADARGQEQRERLHREDEAAREGLKGLEKCIADLSSDLSRLAEQRGKLAAERAAAQESLAALQRAMPELEAAKRAAAASKDFREAARLSGELRALSVQADLASAQLARVSGALAELAAMESSKVSELQELRTMVHEAQRAAAEAHHRYLVFCLGLSRASLDEALASELFEEAGALQAEMAADEAEALVLERTWGFSRPAQQQSPQLGRRRTSQGTHSAGAGPVTLARRPSIGAASAHSCASTSSRARSATTLGPTASQQYQPPAPAMSYSYGSNQAPAFAPDADTASSAPHPAYMPPPSYPTVAAAGQSLVPPSTSSQFQNVNGGSSELGRSVRSPTPEMPESEGFSGTYPTVPATSDSGQFFPSAYGVTSAEAAAMPGLSRHDASGSRQFVPDGQSAMPTRTEEAAVAGAPFAHFAGTAHSVVQQSSLHQQSHTNEGAGLAAPPGPYPTPAEDGGATSISGSHGTGVLSPVAADTSRPGYASSCDSSSAVGGSTGSAAAAFDVPGGSALERPTPRVTAAAADFGVTPMPYERHSAMATAGQDNPMFQGLEVQGDQQSLGGWHGGSDAEQGVLRRSGGHEEPLQQPAHGQEAAVSTLAGTASTQERVVVGGERVPGEVGGTGDSVVRTGDGRW